MPEDTSPKYTAPALEKGLDILELLSWSETGLSQSELARELGRSVSEIFRMLVALQGRGYIWQDPQTDRYTLTTLLFEIAHRTPLIRRLTTAAAPLMRDLAHSINQSVHLAVLTDDSVLIAGQVDPPARHVMSVRLGTRVDVWRASSGRVMMAFQTEAALADMLRRAPLPDGATEADLRADLVAIRERGHEIVDSFVIRGVVNISAPIIDHTGEAIAALTVPHIERFNDPVSFSDCCVRTIAAAAQLTRSLGGGVVGGALPQVFVRS
ncbi:MAG: putative IclR family transcriptional regulator [Rhodobacteraceae bacterium]|uniref:IclR family transcriptional regulator n=1 Tax=Cypionkella sp. TaxID=2811411 RepID=UPI00132C72C7|nr:IclR family transcriptional regulator [Cypionkella sp.]KAF0174836.1 MAG: putative IclR family transcriptional regulator [Paracoccaceae bacterium]MDO8328058.1 IclR family transcriptional regulator [Cypionkella sp.]